MSGGCWAGETCPREGPYRGVYPKWGCKIGCLFLSSLPFPPPPITKTKKVWTSLIQYLRKVRIMVGISRNGVRYRGQVPKNLPGNLSKKNREIRIVWTSLHRYPGLDAIEAR